MDVPIAEEDHLNKSRNMDHWDFTPAQRCQPKQAAVLPDHAARQIDKYPSKT
jgi:hypothetical protein